MMGRLACMDQSEPGKRPEDSRYFPTYQGRHSSLYPSTASGIPLHNQYPIDDSLPHIVGFDHRSRLPEGQRCVSSFAEIPSLEQRARSSYRESSFSPSCASEVKEVRSSAVSPNLKLPPILSTKSSSAPDAISMPPNSVLPMASMFSGPGYQDERNKSSLMDMKMAYENMMVSYFMPQTIKSENAPIPDKHLIGQVPASQTEACVPSGYIGSYQSHPVTSMQEFIKNSPYDDDYYILQTISSDRNFEKEHQKHISESKSLDSRKQFFENSCGRQSALLHSNVNHHTAMDVTSSGCTLLDHGNISSYPHTSLNSANSSQLIPVQKSENTFCSDSSIMVPTDTSKMIPSSEARTSASANEDQTSTSADVSSVLNELSLLMPPQGNEILNGAYRENNITPSFSSTSTATSVNTTSSVKNPVSNFQYQTRSDSTWGRFSVLPPVMSSATPLGGCQHDGDNISVLSYNAFPNNAQNSSQMGMYYTPFSPFSVNFPDNISSALASSPRYSGRSSHSGKGSRNKRALSNSPLSADGIDLNSIIRMSPTSLIAYINGSRSSSSCVSPGSAGDRTGCYGHLSARNSSSSPNSGSNSSSNRRSTSYTPQTATPGINNSRSNTSNVTSDNSNVSEACCSNENIKNDYMAMDDNLLVIQAMQELESGAAMVANGNADFPFCSNIMHPAQMIPESENLQVLPQDIAAFTTEDFIPFIPTVLPPVHTHLQSHYQATPSQSLQAVSQKHNKPPPTYDQHMARKATLQKNSSSESSQPSNSSSFESSEGDKTVAGSSTDTDTNRMYACRWLDCTAVFQDQDEFVTHIEKAHIDQKKGDEFVCYWKLCPRRLHPFNARYKLLVHMRVHSGDKPNKCTYAGCKKAFSRLENLKIHLRSHTGERPYSCTYPGCTKTFSNSSDRTKHQKTHHDTKPYVCQVAGCGKRYTDPSSLRKHVKKSHPDKKEPDRKKIRGGTEEMDPKDLNECLMIQAIKPITLCDASPPEPTDSGLGRSPRSSQPGSSSDHYPGLIYTGEVVLGRSEATQGSSCHTSPSSHHSSPPVQIERDKLPANNNSLRVPVLPPITPIPPQMQSLGVHIQGPATKQRPSSNAPPVLPRELDVRGRSTLLSDCPLSQNPLHHASGIYSSGLTRSGCKSTDLSVPSVLNPPSRYEKENS